MAPSPGKCPGHPGQSSAPIATWRFEWGLQDTCGAVGPKVRCASCPGHSSAWLVGPALPACVPGPAPSPTSTPFQPCQPQVLLEPCPSTGKAGLGTWTRPAPTGEAHSDLGRSPGLSEQEVASVRGGEASAPLTCCEVTGSGSRQHPRPPLHVCMLSPWDTDMGRVCGYQRQVGRGVPCVLCTSESM